MALIPQDVRKFLVHFHMTASQFLQVHFHTVTLPVYHIPKIYWFQVQWLGRILEDGGREGMHMNSNNIQSVVF